MSEPLAIAVALASDPVGLLNDMLLQWPDADDATTIRFVRRLVLERPHFQPGLMLGFAALRVIQMCAKADETNGLADFITGSNVRSSLASALLWYDKVEVESFQVLRLNCSPGVISDREAPPEIAISRGFCERFEELFPEAISLFSEGSPIA